MKIKEKFLNRSIWILIAGVAFYLFWFFCDGVMLTSDSDSYIYATYSREPLYPIFLFVARGIFGETNYFVWVVLIQCVLAAVATWRLTMVVDKKMHLDLFSLGVVECLQFAVVLLCRFAAQRKATYCNEIGSEGLAIPLFTLFVVEIVLYAWEGKSKNLLLTMCYAVCLVSIRKQMYITIVIMLVVYTLLKLARRINWKKYVLALLSVVATVVLFTGVDLVYNWSLRGEAMRHTTDSSAMVITTLYSSGKEDYVYFEDPEMQELFLTIMEEVERKQYNYKYAQDGWMNLYDHYSNHYDLIAFGVINPNFYAYLDANYELSDNDREKAFDELNHEMLQTLLPVKVKQIAQVTLSNMLTGFCNTVSKAHRVLNWYNLLFYIALAVAVIRLWIIKKNNDLYWMAIIVMGTTVINVGAVGLMIFAQTRYMIYNMALIYIVMYLLVRDIWQEIMRKRKQAK